MLSAKEPLLSPVFSFLYMGFAILFFYIVMPALVYSFGIGDEYFFQLSLISFFSVVLIYIGFKTPVFDVLFLRRRSRIFISVDLYIFIIWGVFLLYIFYVFYTAEYIPILSAITGSSDSEVSEQRGGFLKGRAGYESILIYIGTIFSSTLIPYSIIQMFYYRHKLRYFFALLFFIYCISFMAKSLFLSLALPMVVFLSITGRIGAKGVILFGLGSSIVIFIAIFLVSEKTGLSWGIADAMYFSSNYQPNGALDYFIWRAFIVPVFTATDSLVVFYEYFDGDLFYGSTSSFLSLLTMTERINFERYVFMHQFGSWNDTANSNAFFVVDAYVNFSVVGVLIYSFITGIILRSFRLSTDLAYSSLWLLFIFQLFSASLVGTLLSNGFLLILFIAIFFRVAIKK